MKPMFYVDSVPDVDIKLTVYKGMSNVKEDFRGATLWAWVLSPFGCKMPFLVTLESDGTLVGKMPTELPEGVYGIKIIWTKDHNENIQSCYKIHDRFMCGEVADVFVITAFDGNDNGDIINDNSTINVKFHSATYGRDGLDAYELAVLRGETATEAEWLEAYEGKMKKLQEAEDKVEDLLTDIGNVVLCATDEEVEGAEASIVSDPYAVRVKAQTFDEEERWQARDNIQAADAKQVTIAEAVELEAIAVEPNVVVEAVRYATQTLSETEQSTARDNIQAASQFELCNADTAKGAKGRVVVLEEKMALVEQQTNVVVGDMTLLQTTAKDFVVNAINEVYDETGLGVTLDTTAQDNRGAINEINAKVPEKLTADDDIDMVLDVFN